MKQIFSEFISFLLSLEFFSDHFLVDSGENDTLLSQHHQRMDDPILAVEGLCPFHDLDSTQPLDKRRIGLRAT